MTSELHYNIFSGGCFLLINVNVFSLSPGIRHSRPFAGRALLRQRKVSSSRVLHQKVCRQLVVVACMRWGGIKGGCSSLDELQPFDPSFAWMMLREAYRAHLEWWRTSDGDETKGQGERVRWRGEVVSPCHTGPLAVAGTWLQLEFASPFTGKSFVFSTLLHHINLNPSSSSTLINNGVYSVSAPWDRAEQTL